jgi:hypothetical protein
MSYRYIYANVQYRNYFCFFGPGFAIVCFKERPWCLKRDNVNIISILFVSGRGGGGRRG